MSDPTRLTEIRARIFHGVPTTKDAEWLRDELAVAERELDTLRAALDVLRWKQGVDCWCESRPYPDDDPEWHTVACKDACALAAVSPEDDPIRSEHLTTDGEIAAVSPEGEA